MGANTIQGKKTPVDVVQRHNPLGGDRLECGARRAICDGGDANPVRHGGVDESTNQSAAEFLATFIGIIGVRGAGHYPSE